METLKKIFPLSFKEHKGAADLVVGIIVYVVMAIIAGAIIWLGTALTSWIPGVGFIFAWIFGVIGTVVEVYTVAGIVVEILYFAKVIK